MNKEWNLPEDRFFDNEPSQKKAALEIYEAVKDLPIVSPHGHIDPKIFLDGNKGFGTPVDLLIIPDHYVFRLFYSQGMRMEDFGIPRSDGNRDSVEKDHRKIWQRFSENFHLLIGTASYTWLAYELKYVLGIDSIPCKENAQAIYDEIQEKLDSPEFQPRKLFEKMNIEIVSTTDGASDTLEVHQAIRNSGWKGTVVPAFRPDAVMNINLPGFPSEVQRLSEVSKINITDFHSYIEAISQRRSFFKSMGAVSTDHAVITPYTVHLSDDEIERIFQKGMNGTITPEESKSFIGHMLVEMARMSCEDHLVMQLHPGVLRSHNQSVFNKFGVDKGGDIPVSVEFTNNLHCLLNLYGNDLNFRLCLFTIDESTFSRELSPLAGHYPAVRLGAPWWFLDTWNGMTRFLDAVTESAGLCNLSGFVDDTRAFLSIPARHDVWRRVVSDWLAKMTVRSFMQKEDAIRIAQELAYYQPKDFYHLNK